MIVGLAAGGVGVQMVSVCEHRGDGLTCMLVRVGRGGGRKGMAWIWTGARARGLRIRWHELPGNVVRAWGVTRQQSGSLAAMAGRVVCLLRSGCGRCARADAASAEIPGSINRAAGLA